MAATEAVADGPDDEDDAVGRPVSGPVSDPLTGLDFLRSVLPKHNPPPTPPSQPSSSRPPIPSDTTPLHEAVTEPATAAQQAVPHEASVGAPSRPAPPSKLRYRQSTLGWATPPPPSTVVTPASDDSPMQDSSMPTQGSPRPTQDSSKPKSDNPELKYEEAHERFKSKWSTDYSWLVLTKTSSGAPSFKCSICLEFAGLNGKCGRRTEGATDVQTQSFKKHEGTVKHRFALQRQEDLLQKYGRQQRIDMHPKAQDMELLQVSSLVDSLYFMGKCNEPMDSWIRLVRYLAKKKVPGEALAAKAAAEKIPTFNMVDDVIRAIAEYLGRSGPWHQRFMELQEVFTSTILEVQGIHNVRWLSRGAAVARFVQVLPAIMVMLSEWKDQTMYELVTSYRFQFLIRFLADMLEQLNVLSSVFQKRELDYALVHMQIVRTTSILEARYVDCGDDFGGGPTERLYRFIEKHGPGGTPEMVVEGASSDGSMNRFKVKLHERTNPSYRGPGHHHACVALCTDMAELVVEQLQSKLGDRDSLSGVRLFIPEMWQPHWDRDARQAQCLEWLMSLVTLFRADEADEILPVRQIALPSPTLSRVTSPFRRSSRRPLRRPLSPPLLPPASLSPLPTDRPPVARPVALSLSAPFPSPSLSPLPSRRVLSLCSLPVALSLAPLFPSRSLSPLPSRRPLSRPSLPVALSLSLHPSRRPLSRPSLPIALSLSAPPSLSLIPSNRALSPLPSRRALSLRSLPIALSLSAPFTSSLLARLE
ncbi:unnamed protein product [Closterium sp. Naga37s-1]|nr:unnamed protein product [Closterium sp. Naga37s-1]